MRSNILGKIVLVLLILVPILVDPGCKKQPKCGCGKDVLYTLDSALVTIYYNEASRSAYFYPYTYTGATYYFCNPGKWIDTLKTMNTEEYLLLSGKVYYECNYLYNSGNYSYQIPAVYQVDVTSIQEDNYGKKKK
jgi:hypothetical protein